MPANSITQTELKEILHYDPDTGVFTWKITPSHNIKAGSVAGTLAKRGYIHISYKSRIFKAHRLAFLYMNGETPTCDVDHANRIRNDNRWVNLRLATNGNYDNMQNRKAKRNTESGLLGVCRDKRIPYRPWRATIMVNKKSIHVGYFATPEEAHAAYLEKKRMFHPFFAG